MQKKIIALAIAGLVAAPAFAADTVAIYGVMGAYMLNTKSSSAAGVETTVNTLNSDGQSGSRIGFKGTEDMGNGLKTNFVIESSLLADASGIGSASGVQGLGNRQIHVGLSGNFGSVSVGRQYGPEFYLLAANADTFGYADWSPLLQSGMANITRLSNSVIYATPNVNGFTGKVFYGFSEKSVAPKSNGEYVGLSAEYSNGPMYLAYAHENLDTSTATSSSNKYDYFAATYNLGMAKLQAAYNTTNFAGIKANGWVLGANIPVSKAGTVSVSYADHNDKSAANVDVKSYGIDYSHAMSKRTNLVVGYSKQDPNGQAYTNKMFAGIRHTF